MHIFQKIHQGGIHLLWMLQFDQVKNRFLCIIFGAIKRKENTLYTQVMEQNK